MVLGRLCTAGIADRVADSGSNIDTKSYFWADDCAQSNSETSARSDYSHSQRHYCSGCQKSSGDRWGWVGDGAGGGGGGDGSFVCEMGPVAVEMKSGVVYPGREANVGQRVAVLKMLGRGVKIFGFLMMGFGFSSLVMIYWPLVMAQFNYKFLILNLKSSSNVSISKEVAKPNWDVPDENYSVYIPKIGAVAKVVPSVDTNNKKVYLEALKLGVAEAAGLAHPGEKGTTFLFAHSAAPIDFARYNAVFYLLDKLAIDDRIEVVYKGKLYKYSVTSVQRLAPSDTRYLRPQNDEELLVLQTCWPPGTTWKRLVLTARRSVVY